MAFQALATRNFQKSALLTASEISIIKPTTNGVAPGIDLSLLPMTAIIIEGILSQTIIRGELENELSIAIVFIISGLCRLCKAFRQ
jgi:hypothetical protein